MSRCWDKQFADRVTKACVSKFNSLGKTGKPKDREWTPLACFLKEEHGSGELEVVALGTGSKCVGEKLIDSAGLVLHDSHAEVVARRAFVVYLLNQLEKASQGKTNILEVCEEKFRLKSGIDFHFYVSHTPCGDGSIFPKQEWTESVGKMVLPSTKPLNENHQQKRKEGDCNASDGCDSLPPEKKVKVEVNCSDINKTSEVNCSDINKTTEVNCSDINKTSKDTKLQKIKVELSCSDTNKDGENTDIQKVKEKSCSSSDRNQISRDTNKNSEDTDIQKVKEESCSSSDTNQIRTDTKFQCDTNFPCDIKSPHDPPDIHRTGAKCVAGEVCDPKLPGVHYHVTEALRTKPGRGDPTLSMSCSDKMFKWSVMGVQGALLMLFLKAPVYIQTITIGRCPYSHEAMQRAVFGRFNDKLKNIQLAHEFKVTTPVLLYSDVDFIFSRGCVSSSATEDSQIMPSPTSVIWSGNVHGNKHEAATNGHKLGATKKSMSTLKGSVSICRRAILLKVYASMSAMKHFSELSSDLTYDELKNLACDYQKAWQALKVNVLCHWTVKPKHAKLFTLKGDVSG